jgi:hypothetical protein
MRLFRDLRIALFISDLYLSENNCLILDEVAGADWEGFLGGVKVAVGAAGTTAAEIGTNAVSEELAFPVSSLGK